MKRFVLFCVAVFGACETSRAVPIFQSDQESLRKGGAFQVLDRVFRGFTWSSDCSANENCHVNPRDLIVANVNPSSRGMLGKFNGKGNARSHTLGLDAGGTDPLFRMDAAEAIWLTGGDSLGGGTSGQETLLTSSDLFGENEWRTFDNGDTDLGSEGSTTLDIASGGFSQFGAGSDGSNTNQAAMPSADQLFDPGLSALHTPEPFPMILTGSGLIALGIMLKHRRTAG
jgi:hypothetical protein